jgi:CheY-like chemotaxis protein
LPPRRILVVDDNRDAVETLAELLEVWGHEVWTAADGPGGLQAAAEHQPEVILLDIGLPGIDGYEVARRLRAMPGLDSTWLIALTGYGQPEDRQRALEAGFDYHLTKPLDLAVLQQLLLDYNSGVEDEPNRDYSPAAGVGSSASVPPPPAPAAGR